MFGCPGVGGRNLAKQLILYIPGGAGFLPSAAAEGFFGNEKNNSFRNLCVFVVAWYKVQNCFNVSGIVVASFTSEKKRCR